MTQDEIVRMAREAGAVERYFGNQLHGIAFHKKEWLERFAALVAAHAREKQAEQEPVIDLSKVRHEDKCRYWDDETFCDCGADSYALLEWHRNNKAAPVRTKDLTDAVDAAMVEMQNIHPPLRRSECERLIRAANYAAPVRTKDLTDADIADVFRAINMKESWSLDFARAVIAKFKEKNK